MKINPLCSFPAESYAMRTFAIPMLLLLPVLGIACFFSLSIIGFIAGILLITLGVFKSTRLINEVCFYENEIHLNYFLFKKIVILKYDRIKLIRPTTEPKTRERIFAADMKYKERIKKFTWNCSDEEFNELKPLLLKHGIRINSEE